MRHVRYHGSFGAIVAGVLVWAAADGEGALAAPVQPVDIVASSIPSGWMPYNHHGTIALFPNWQQGCASPPRCVKVVYTPGKPGWAGIYWQNRENNWCRWPGLNLTGRGLTRVSFRARGERGGELIEFKAGGIRDCAPYRDLFEVRRTVRLTRTWTSYTLDLRGKSLASVLGLFAWIATTGNNPSGATFYLDDMRYE